MVYGNQVGRDKITVAISLRLSFFSSNCWAGRLVQPYATLILSVCMSVYHGRALCSNGSSPHPIDSFLAQTYPPLDHHYSDATNERSQTVLYIHVQLDLPLTLKSMQIDEAAILIQQCQCHHMKCKSTTVTAIHSQSTLTLTVNITNSLTTISTKETSQKAQVIDSMNG